MILKQKAFQKLGQMMKLKENQEKSATSVYRTRNGMHNKAQCAWSGTVHCRNLSATEPSISPSVITCTVQVNRTSWLRRNNNENFCEVTKICLLETK